jgi:hypothetical protein
MHYYSNGYNDPNYSGIHYSIYPSPESRYKPATFSQTSGAILHKGVSIEKETHVPIEKKIIDIGKIESISDLLHIIETNEYNSSYEYNIDLKLLSNIKTELSLLNNMIGMQGLKKSILDQLLYFMQGMHLGAAGDFKHTALFGPPGTGKTEIAKIIGQMYSKMGILKNNVFKKVTRNDLVAGYLGQTAIKTKAAITECLGGVLFIDEAYSLSNASNDLDNYSKECIDTLCEALSDHKHDLMVIIAGYEDELRANFFGANQGLESRFIWRFTIDQYTPVEMRDIYLKKVADAEWKIDTDACPKQWFEKNRDHFKFYGRDMELLLFYTKICHSKRVFGKSEDLKKTITSEDINQGLAMFLKNKTKENDVRKYIISSMYV